MNSPSPDSMSRSRSITPSPTKKGRPPHHDGVLYGKTGICFSWKQLYAKARTTTLHLNEGVIGGDLFTVDINDYDVSWQGKLQEKFSIVMKNRSDSLSDIRWLYLGTDDEATAKGWYQYFLSVMDRSPSKTIGDMGRQDEDIFHKDKLRASTLGDKNKGGSPPFASQNEKGYDLTKSPYKNINDMQEYVEQDLVDTGVEDDFSVEGGDFMLPEDAPEWVHALYGEHIASKSIWREAGQTIPKGGQWEMLADEGDKIETAIANSNLDRQMFRCEYSFRRIPVQVLVKALLDVEKKRDWDNTVESLKVLFYTPTTKQSILQQINKAQGKFQFKREFLYIRYIFQTQGAYFIIEKSHKGDGFSDIIGLSKDMAYRGHTDYSIMRIIEKDDRSYVTHLIKSTNGGFVSTAQDTKITLNSLINLKNIEKIFPLYWDEDESDLVLIPCPKREEKLRWRQMIVNKSNKKKPVVSPTRPKFHLNIPNLNRDNIVPHGVSNRSRSARSVKTHRTDEENLQEEDIDEKILVLSKQKKQDMWEIELSTSSKQVSPDYLGIYNKKIV